MFRILIVEDEPGTSEKLQSRLSAKIPEAQVDTAPTVRRAQELIGEAKKEREFYHAFVLDIRLPRDVGEPPLFDETLCKTIRAAMPKAIVAHISFFLDDNVVQDHMEHVHYEQIDRSFRLSKRDVEWFPKLEGKLRSFLYSISVEEQLNGLFGASESPEFEPRGRHESNSGRSVTHDLAELSRDISAHWRYLDPDLQERIKKFFDVTTDGDEVIVSEF